MNTQLLEQTNAEGEYKPEIKAVALTDKAKGCLYLKDGKIAVVFDSFDGTDLVLPLTVKHVFKQGLSETGYGQNWRLNISKKLKLSSDDTQMNTKFVYTDELGDEHVFSEVYYYVESGIKKRIADKSQIDIGLNGALSYNGNQVYKKQYCKGYTLIPEIDDFKGHELIEQRADERIELEEYLLQTEKELKGYVRVNKTTGALSEKNVNFTEAGNFTKENYRAFLDGVTAESTDIIIKEAERSQWSESEKQVIINGAVRNLECIKYSFLKYFKKKAELDMLVKNSPVNYLKGDDGILNGFNAEGDLVLFADSYGNFLRIERGADGRIVSVYDSKKAVVRFEYKNDLLQSITDSRCRQVNYTYNASGRLTKITYPDGQTYTLTYTSDNKISTFTSGYGYTCTFTYLNSKISRLTTKKSNETISDLQIAFNSDNSVNFTSERGESETFRFNSENKISEYITNDERGRGVTKAYTYADGGKKVTITTTKSYDYSENRKTTETKEYDDFGLLTRDRIEPYLVFEETQEETREEIEIDYYYDDNNRLIKKSKELYRITYHYSEEDDTYSDTYQTIIEKYSYDEYGNLKLTESYVEGSETSSGINFEERVYNDNGNMVKCIRWNSLDASSKFYEEYEREEDGRIRYEKDETGAYSAMYEYVDGTSAVNAVTYANGGKIAYGRDIFSDRLTSVTQSTAEGEANTNEIHYSEGKLKDYSDDNVKIAFEVDNKGRKTGLYVDFKKQWSCTYNDTRGYNSDKSKYNYLTQTKTLDTGSGNVSVVTERYSSSRPNLCESLTVNGTLLNTVTYYADDSLSVRSYLAEGNKNKYYSYNYDRFNRLTSVVNRVRDTNETILTENYFYNVDGTLWKKQLTGAVSQTYTYSISRYWKVKTYSVQFDGFEFRPLKDVYDRNTGKVIYNGFNKIAGEHITYRKVGDHATNMPASIWFGIGGKKTDNIKYKYDSCGNICEITQNGHLVARYTYDALNRLIREDNKPLNRTTVVVYDNSGNVVDRCYYPFTEYDVELYPENASSHITYEYEGNKLVRSIGSAAATYEYNNLGNPTVYRGKTLTWKYGTQLTKYDTTTFEYDGLGRRTKKWNDGKVITFVYDSEDRLIKQGSVFEFIYDNMGVVGFKYYGGTYFYRRDAQGNIIAILNSNGGVEATYTYDAWGCHEVGGSNKSLGNLNPFRYRGYYYDTETGLYYLQTRYYDPEVGRFISQDDPDYADPETINGLNLYAYCGNNPVMNVDPTGKISISFILISMLIGGFVGGLSAGLKARNNGLDAKGVALSILGGVLMGAATSGAFALGGAAVTGLTVLGKTVSGVTLLAVATYGTATANIINYYATAAAYGEDTSIDRALMSGVNGFFEGLASFSLGAFAGMSGQFKYADKSLIKETGYLFKKPIESITRFVGFSLPAMLIRRIFQLH